MPPSPEIPGFGRPFAHHETSKDRAAQERHANDHFARIPSAPLRLPEAPAGAQPHKLVPRYAQEGASSGSRSAGDDATTTPAAVFRRYSCSISVAGVVPTAGEIGTALSTCYVSGNVPRDDDLVLLSVGAVLKFTARTLTSNPGLSGIFSVSFTVISTNYFAVLNQTGLY